jgi:hypothetical protein
MAVDLKPLVERIKSAFSIESNKNQITSEEIEPERDTRWCLELAISQRISLYQHHDNIVGATGPNILVPVVELIADHNNDRLAATRAVIIIAVSRQLDRLSQLNSEKGV